MAGGRQAVIDYEFLRGRPNESVFKELCVVCTAAPEMFPFKSHYKMADQDSSENGLYWADGLIELTKYTRSLQRSCPVSHTSTPRVSLNVCSWYE